MGGRGEGAVGSYTMISYRFLVINRVNKNEDFFSKPMHFSRMVRELLFKSLF